MARITVWGDFKANNVDRLSLSGELTYLLNTSDVNVVNMEAPVQGIGKPIRKSGPNISQSIGSPEWLENYGFNVVSMANNHTMDYGEEGMDQTRKSFKKAQVIGCGRWDEAYRPAIVTTKDGLRIGILACTHCEFGTLTDKTHKSQKGTAWAGAADFERAIQQNGGGKWCDFLLVIAHCGVEYIEQPLPEWRECYRKWIELGADAVIASHPHVPQGWEYYHGKPICYSLGNFCFTKLKKKSPAFWNESLCCELTLSSPHDIKLRMIPIIYNPLTCYISNNNSMSFEMHLDYLNKALHDEKQYMEIVNSEIKKHYSHYLDQFTRGGIIANFFSKGLLKGIADGFLGRGFFNSVHCLNNIQCESHRWAILRVMRMDCEKK